MWKAKVSYFKEQFPPCGSNPKKFWETVKDLENKPSSSQLLMSLHFDDVVVTDKKHMAELFNHHFIESGFLFDSALPPLLMRLSPMLLPLFPLPHYKVSPCRQSLSPRC
jgi:hypothetical protein